MSEAKPLVPRLRFPEFRDNGPWEVKRLGDKGVARFIRERITSEDIPRGHYVSTASLLSDFGGLSSDPKAAPPGSVIAYREGDILISNIRPYLKKLWVADRSGGASNDVLVARAGPHALRAFLGHLLMSEHFIEYVMAGAKGVKMPRGDLAQILNFPVPLPDKSEQQKIADCLTSLDDLIRTEQETVAALRKHKLGLMQRLFPAPGETTPPLRFPKFRDDGPWVIKRMGEGITLVSGQHLGPSDYKTEPSDYPYFTGPSDFTDDNGSVGKWVPKEASPQLAVEGDVLVTVKGSGVGSLWRLKLPKVAMGRQLMAVRGTSFHPSFLHYFLDQKSTHLAALAIGNMIPGLSRDDLLSLPLAAPAIPEQKKIADCLTSLDDLIRGKERLVEALEDHRRGLMQRLFPREST